MKLRYKLFIFDIDGTLTSTNRLIFDSFNHIYDKYFGKILTPKEVIALFGPTEEEIINELFGEDAEEAIVEYFNYYEKNHRIAALHEGIAPLLDFLIEQGAHIAAFTGKGRRSAEITLKELGIFGKIGILISGDDVTKKKPSGEGINKILQFYNLKPEDAIMIGDSTADIKAAREAGVAVASVIWDCYSIDAVRGLNGEMLFNTVDELRGHFNGDEKSIS
ncbi:MAG: phosphoglycolate phosphatase [Ignavibacteriaceae bacterium]|nr:MAG: HAD family hydrolase [Chlorobiota bacterium]GJQ32150.1 MAG: phosphoglycolate phosphatase [Ignavibacteriaceae bacterium]